MKFSLTKNLSALKARAIYDPVSPDAIAKLFCDRGWGLPEDYGVFLSEWNGLTFSPDYVVSFPIAPRGTWDRIPFEWPTKVKDKFKKAAICGQLGFLSGIGNKTVSDIRRNQDGYSFADFVPKEFMRIGDGHFDDSIALAISGPHFGKVAYFSGPDANRPLKGEPSPSIDNLRFVALTFTDFWNSLVVVEL